jgi:hypothetical protein
LNQGGRVVLQHPAPELLDDIGAPVVADAGLDLLVCAVSPQVQLAGQTKSGMLRRTRWNTVQQLPVDVFRISDRRLKPQQRVDGAVVFERPPIKQSTEGLFLQIADSAAVEKPTLAPISFRAPN